MCNRYNLRATKKELVDLFGHLEDDFAPVADHWPMRPGLVFRPREDGPACCPQFPVGAYAPAHLALRP